jgi:antirestriction protein ArdC
VKEDLYQDVANRIIAEMKKAVVPWVKPWSATAGRNEPANAVTNRPYSGANVVLLWMATDANGWTIPRFVTFKQALELGGSVRKGEHGTKVYFVKRLRVRDRKDNGEVEEREVPLLREYTVFSVAQCDNLPARLRACEAKVRHHDERDATIDEFVAATKINIREGAGGDRAYYTTAGDFVATPRFTDFKSADSFYATTFHELGHATGAKHRLDREFGKRFGDRAYAAEELVAELTSAFLCAEFDLDGELRHAGYIENWIALLKDDPRAFFTAASKAQQAADFMRQTVLADDDGEADGALREAA